jgi:hypothetical protein
VGTIPKSNRKIPHWEQFQNPIEKYHTVGTIPKSNRKIPHCGNNSKIQ